MDVCFEFVEPNIEPQYTVIIHDNQWSRSMCFRGYVR